jgi:hypothetical protein
MTTNNGATQDINAEDARELFDRVSGQLGDVSGQDMAAIYHEVLSNGDSPTDLFARTYIKDDNEAKRLALAFALRAEDMRDDPVWGEEAWVHIPSLALRAYQLYLQFKRSIGGQTVGVALQAYTGIVVPEMNRPDKPSRRVPSWLQRKRRRPEQQQGGAPNR